MSYDWHVTSTGSIKANDHCNVRQALTATSINFELFRSEKDEDWGRPLINDLLVSDGGIKELQAHIEDTHGFKPPLKLIRQVVHELAVEHEMRRGWDGRDYRHITTYALERKLWATRKESHNAS